MSVENLSAFFLASVLLGLSPGPDNLFVMMQSAMHGRPAGMRVVLGLCTGLLVHTAAVAAGLAAVFAASELAFQALKIAGALYLLWLAWQAFRAPVDAPAEAAAPALEGWALYRRGVLMNLTNPKVSIFFLAFLPQFADPARGALAGQIALLGAVFIVATLLVFGAVAWFAGSLGGLLKRSRATRRLLNLAAGTVFAALAARLALAQR
ncbi:LysE family translocator [Burkholderiaceae bacterium FT117]|uniref:LysE family translocator n=1 Tax=Zeimonas sediminis TaxID=2944268 RepID=UPI00234308A3|nr:LysE family translocator [Zeimonas sediminis]MCM5569701.1 LysE family translocator [Zeimonas sediminis]